MEQSVELLLACLRQEHDETQIKHLRKRSAEDWREAAAAAESHGVGPLFFHAVRDISGRLNIPGELMEALRRKYYAAAARNIRVYHELEMLLGAFGRAEIPVVLLKGAHLAEHVYGNIALRSMCDVDLLVRREDLERVEGVFGEAGGEADDTHRTDFHVAYQMRKSRLIVEVHWDLVSPLFPCNVDLDGVWSRAQTARFGQANALVLSPEDLLLHLCIHTVVHAADMRIRMLCDIAESVCLFEKTLHWAALVERGRSWSASRCIYVLLRLAKEFLGAPVCEEHLTALQPEGFEEHRFLLALEQLFNIREGGRKTTLATSRLWSSKGVKYKIKFVAVNVFLSRKTMSLMYSVPADSWRIFLYYPLRVKDLFTRHSRSAWSLLQGDSAARRSAEKLNETLQLREWLLSE